MTGPEQAADAPEADALEADALEADAPEADAPETTNATRNRVAGAPISWGVCEVPNWGYQLTPERVLTEMQAVGLQATEFGPDGFLPADPDQMAAVLDAHRLTAVGGFTPVVMHQPVHDPLPELDQILVGYDATPAEILVLSAASGLDGYDTRPVLDEDGWRRLLRNLDRIADLASEHGVRAVLHPHVGTMIESRAEVQRVLDGSAISLCVDTGHLLIGGTDPAELTRQYPTRVAHAHLKDVDATIAARVRAGRLTYTEAVAEGMYRPLGTGDVDIADIVNTLQSNGYAGWYVLEQDTILTEEPRGEGPVRDVRISADYVNGLLATAPAPASR
jgi:inosose dehydratase